MIHRPSNWRVGLPLAVGTAVLWGAMPLLLKGLLNQLDPMTLTFCRQFGCGVLMVLLLLWRRDLSWRPLRRGRVAALAGVCALGLTTNAMLFNIGLQHSAPSATQVLAQLGPVLLLVGAVVLFRESFTPQQWFGAVLAISGLVVFFHDHVDDLLRQSSYGFGMLVMMIAPLFWASFALAQRRLAGVLDPRQILLVVYLVGGAAMMPVAQLPRIAALDAAGWTLLAGIVAVYFASYLALGTAMQHWEASRVSSIITLTPLFTLVFSQGLAWWLPGHLAVERHDLLSWAGAAVVVTGSLLAALPRRRLRVRHG